MYQPFHLAIVLDQGSVRVAFYAKVTRVPFDCIQVRFGCRVERRATRLFVSFHIPIACKAHKDVALGALSSLVLFIEAARGDPDAAKLYRTKQPVPSGCLGNVLVPSSFVFRQHG